MKRHEPLHISAILQTVLGADHIQQRMLERQAITVWRELVGPAAWRRTLMVWVDRGVLYVRITSAPLRHELAMRRSGLCQAVNAVLDKPIIKEIRII